MHMLQRLRCGDCRRPAGLPAAGLQRLGLLRRHRVRIAAAASGGPSDPRRNNNNMSRVEAFMRTTPPLNNFVDGKLLLGDAVMVLATEAASERIPLDQMPQLAASLIIAWVLAGTLRGDYRGEEDPDNDNPLASAMGWPILIAIINACLTWAVSMAPAMMCYTYLVSHFMVDPNSVLTCRGEHLLGPQMEVSIALLITMACWRGIAARLRL